LGENVTLLEATQIAKYLAMGMKIVFYQIILNKQKYQFKQRRFLPVTSTYTPVPSVLLAEPILESYASGILSFLQFHFNSLLCQTL
jgi:hypothetical protein